jgi:hypothetical protein
MSVLTCILGNFMKIKCQKVRPPWDLEAVLKEKLAKSQVVNI